MEEEEVRLSQAAQESTKTWREPKLKWQTKAENSCKRPSGRALRVSLVALIVSLLALGHFAGAGALGADRHSADGTQGVFVSQPSDAHSDKDNILKNSPAEDREATYSFYQESGTDGFRGQLLCPYLWRNGFCHTERRIRVCPVPGEGKEATGESLCGRSW